MRSLALFFIVLSGFALGFRSRASTLPAYPKPFVPLLSAVNFSKWMMIADTLPQEPYANLLSTPAGTIMLACPGTTHGVTSPLPCYNTGPLTAPIGSFGFTNVNRLATLRYFALRYQIQLQPYFFTRKFFDPTFVAPTVATSVVSAVALDASDIAMTNASATATYPAGNGPSVMNAYMACVRFQVYKTELALGTLASSPPAPTFTDPFASQFNAKIKTATALGAQSELITIQRHMKVLSYMFPDIYPWEMLLYSTNLTSKCASVGATIP